MCRAVEGRSLCPNAVLPSRARMEQRKTRQRRVEILKSAAAAFRRRGYHGASMGEIAQALPAPLLRRVIAKRDRFDRGIRRLLQEGMDAGAFAPGDPKLLTFAILGAVNWIPRWFDPAGPATSEEIGRVFAEYLVSGLQHRTR